MRLGIICPSEIAFRRFLPAVEKLEDHIEFVGLGVSSFEERFATNPDISREVQESVLKEEYKKAQCFIDAYGGKIFESYEAIVTSDELDAIYIPLPPALHFKWAKLALEYGKHVLVEKPSTILFNDSKELVTLARRKKLALHENYMFVFHKQLDVIRKTILSGEIGDIRLYRIAFGFPRRSANDFRYNKNLGGGALYDAGGYTIKYAAKILGETAKITYAQMNYISDFDVDIYGSGTLVNDRGSAIQIAYGMDNNYKCELEVWGSKGCLLANRVLTAPSGFEPDMVIRCGNKDVVQKLPADDAFRNSINYFLKCIGDSQVREESYEMIARQAELVENFKLKAVQQYA